MNARAVPDIMGVCLLTVCITANSVLAARVVQWNFDKDKVVDLYGCGLDDSTYRKGRLWITETANIDSVIACGNGGWQWTWNGITGAQFKFTSSVGISNTIVHDYKTDESALVIAPTYKSSSPGSKINITWVAVDIDPTLDVCNSNIMETSLFLWVFRDSVGAGPCVGEIQGTTKKLGSPGSFGSLCNYCTQEFQFTLSNIPVGVDVRDMWVTFALGDCANYKAGMYKYAKVKASANPTAESGDIYPCNIGEGSVLWTLTLADVPKDITTVTASVWASGLYEMYNSTQLCGIKVDVESTSSGPNKSRTLR